MRGDALSGLGRPDEAAQTFERAIGAVLGTRDDRLFVALALYTGQPEVAAHARSTGLPWATEVGLAMEAAEQPRTGGTRTAWTPPPRRKA